MLAGLLRRRATQPSDPARAATFVGAGRTHVGRVRSVNEDRLLDRGDRGLWAVADGMGGHSAGAAAATLALDRLDALANGSATLDEAMIRAALGEANRAIHDMAIGSAVTSGTTIVVALLQGHTATICWAGDSRAYRLHEGRAQRLTRDHSIVQELVDAGVLTDVAAERHPQSNVVTRALGVAPTVTLDSVVTTLSPGDRLMLCSDGISRSLDARDFLTLPTGIDAIADRLLANALQRDGSDNATLVVIGEQQA